MTCCDVVAPLRCCFRCCLERMGWAFRVSTAWCTARDVVYTYQVRLRKLLASILPWLTPLMGPCLARSVSSRIACSSGSPVSDESSKIFRSQRKWTCLPSSTWCSYKSRRVVLDPNTLEGIALPQSIRRCRGSYMFIICHTLLTLNVLMETTLP